VIVGCGAIGAAVANLLVRAGVGRIRILDRDFVSPPTCSGKFFSTKRMRGSAAQAVAAERKLRALNSEIKIEGVVADLNSRNAEQLLSGFPLILDGTDNFETRFLVNDFAVRAAIPWIYAAAVASYGLTLTIRPHNRLSGMLAGNRRCAWPGRDLRHGWRAGSDRESDRFAGGGRGAEAALRERQRIAWDG